MKISVILANNRYLAKIYSVITFLIVKITRSIRTFYPAPSDDIILVIAFRKLGDSVFTIPALKAVKKSTEKDIFIFCFSEARPIFELFFNAESVISFSNNDFLFNRRAVKKTVRKKLSELNPGIIYDFAGSTLSASILFNTSAKKVIGINEKYYNNIYSQFIPIRTTPHILDIYLDAAGVEESRREKLKEFDLNYDKNGYIVLHPFAGWNSKEWNLHKFIYLAIRLGENFNVALVSQPDRIQQDVKMEITRRGIRIVETKDINELIEVLKGCSLIVANDSGPLYIANCLGKPTFAIYGPTNPAYHVPLGKGNRFVQKVIKCSPAEQKYCFTNAGRRGCPAYECMNLLSVDEVHSKINEFIEYLGLNHTQGRI